MIKKYFYWEKYDVPRFIFDKIKNKDVEYHGRYVCNHPLVGNAFANGYLNGKTMSLMSVLIMKDGSRKYFYNETYDYQKVNEYLNGLKEQA